MKIDSNFIFQWEPRYDEIESDEGEYLSLIKRVRKERTVYLSISKHTLERIINWKSPRAKGAIKWDDYDVYYEAFQKMLNPDYSDKMKKLLGLSGFGVPVASTILHFTFPQIFPICDIRTVEVLNSCGYLKSKTMSGEGYSKFQKAMLRIRTELVHYNLRQIDRALFAYHKIQFSKSTKPTLNVEKSNGSIKTPIHESIRSICERLGAGGKEIERQDIIAAAKKEGINESSVLPADYCDNTNTGRWSKHSFLHSIGPGRYILIEYKSRSANL